MFAPARLLALAGVLAGCAASYEYTNEVGSLRLRWDLSADASAVQMEVCGNATGYVGIGFGGGMAGADMVIVWVDDAGVAHAGDYYSSEHKRPQLDTDLGGTNDVAVVGGSRVGNYTCVTFKRLLSTGDKYDAVVRASAETDMIYAFGAGAPGDLHYHGEGHNHVRVNFSRADGIPSSAFGSEEAGFAARDFVQTYSVGVLATLQVDAPGRQGLGEWPYASVADYADEQPSTGRPLVLLSKLERNIVNTKAVPKCSLAIHTPADNETDPMAAPRVTLLGSLTPVPADELPKARDTYLRAHPMAKMWIDFSDFVLYRMDVADVYWVGGFGNDHYIGWVAADKYLAAQPATK